MKSSILLLALTAAAFSSCTTAYKAGQTPDDVYYSPTRPAQEYVQVEKQNDRYYRGSEETYDDYYEDRFLRMRINDRYRCSALYDYYFYNTYAYNAYGHYNNWYSPWNSYWAWNSYYNPYNPYCSGLPYYYYPGGSVIKSPRVITPPSRAMVFNPNSYLNNNNENRSNGSRIINSYNNNNSSRYNNNNSRYSNRNSNTSNRSSLGESVRKVFSNDNNNSTPSRSYNPPSNNSSSSSNSSRSSSGSGSSSGGSSRPPR